MTYSTTYSRKTRIKFLPFFRLLHISALWENADLLEDLLRGDELQCLNGRDSWGRTALHAAATNESSKCLRILLQVSRKLGFKSRIISDRI